MVTAARASCSLRRRSVAALAMGERPPWEPHTVCPRMGRFLHWSPVRLDLALQRRGVAVMWSPPGGGELGSAAAWGARVASGIALGVEQVGPPVAGGPAGAFVVDRFEAAALAVEGAPSSGGPLADHRAGDAGWGAGGEVGGGVGAGYEGVGGDHVHPRICEKPHHRGAALGVFGYRNAPPLSDGGENTSTSGRTRIAAGVAFGIEQVAPPVPRGVARAVVVDGFQLASVSFTVGPSA